MSGVPNAYVPKSGKLWAIPLWQSMQIRAISLLVKIDAVISTGFLNIVFPLFAGASLVSTK